MTTIDQSPDSPAEKIRGKLNDLLRQLAPLGSKDAARAALREMGERAYAEKNEEAALVVTMARTWLERPGSVFP